MPRRRTEHRLACVGGEPARVGNMAISMVREHTKSKLQTVDHRRFPSSRKKYYRHPVMGIVGTGVEMTAVEGGWRQK